MEISYEEFKSTDLYQQFILDNPDVGDLKVQSFTAFCAIPISDVKIVVSKDIGNYKVIFYEGYTYSSGIITDIMLPAPDAITNALEVPGYTIYNMSASSNKYSSLKNYTIGMFGNIRVLQYVKMTPEVGDFNAN